MTDYEIHIFKLETLLLCSMASLFNMSTGSISISIYVVLFYKKKLLIKLFLNIEDIL